MANNWRLHDLCIVWALMTVMRGCISSDSGKGPIYSYFIRYVF